MSTKLQGQPSDPPSAKCFGRARHHIEQAHFIHTFFAQAAATGYVSRTATADRGSASGIYLSCYFFGVGS